MFTSLPVRYCRAQNGVEKEVKALMAREVAPLAATEDMYVNTSGASVFGE